LANDAEEGTDIALASMMYGPLPFVFVVALGLALFGKGAPNRWVMAAMLLVSVAWFLKGWLIAFAC
jgi:hypothetical protein